MLINELNRLFRTSKRPASKVDRYAVAPGQAAAPITKRSGLWQVTINGTTYKNTILGDLVWNLETNGITVIDARDR